MFSTAVRSKSSALNLSSLFRTTGALSGANPTRTKTGNNLLSRIVPLGDPDVSLSPVIDQWVKEGKKISEFEFKRIIRTLRNSRRYTQALEVTELMGKGKDKISSGHMAIWLDLLGRVRGLDTAESYFHIMPDEHKDAKTYGALLNCYAREGLTEKSLSLMAKMKEMGFLSSLVYNVIMCLYINSGQSEKVPDVLQEMKKNGVSPDSFSYAIQVKSYGERADLDSMENALLDVEGLPGISMHWSTYSMAAHFFVKAGLNEKAVYYMKKCEAKVLKHALGYSHLISLYAALGNKDEMVRLWHLQRKMCKKQPNQMYVAMLSSLVNIEDFEEAEKLLKKWESSCFHYDFRVPNVLLQGYCNKGLTEKAEKKLQDIVKGGRTAAPNTWSTIAAGYASENNMEKAFECFKKALAVEAENRKWFPKPDLISSILNWLGDHGDVDDVENFVKLLTAKVAKNREIYHVLIKANIRAGKDVDGILESMKSDEIEENEETLKILSLREQNSQ